MSIAKPILRDTRRRDLAAAVGQTAFTLDVPVWDAADVKVSVRTAPDTVFLPVTSAFTVVLVDNDAGATIIFATPPRAHASDPAMTIRVETAAVFSRTTDVTRGGIIRGAALEREFDRTATVFQELRRDVDDWLAIPTTVAAAVVIARHARDEAKTDADAARQDAHAAAISAGEAAASAAAVDASSLLTKAGNLAGLASTAIARQNLGAQAALGFTPVGQGTGTLQTQHPIGIGLDASGSSKLRLQIDQHDVGTVWPIDISGVAANATALTTSTGTAPSFAARAWARVDASGGIMGSGNVSSVTKSATGTFVVNFVAPIAGSYAIMATATVSAVANRIVPLIGGQSASAVNIICAGGTSLNTLTDPVALSIAVFG